MNNYYTYVYYDADWVAYYVGKGSYKRAFKKHYRVTIPSSSEHIQVFYFDEKWKAFECEVSLINLFKRKSDGGSLLNTCLGGEGAPGRKMSDSHYAKLMGSRCSPISLTNVNTNEVREFKSCTEASKVLNIPRTSLSSLRLTSRKASKTCHNWRLTNEYS